MKTPLILSLAAALWVLPMSASADALPTAVQALAQHGVNVVGPFTSRTGLKAYAALANGQPAALYVTSNGAVIVGTALDARGQGLDEDALQAALRKPLPESVWQQLEGSRWIADGAATAPRIVYVFTDPNCPFCAKLWFDARPWVDSGKVQLRHVLVGILSPTSAGKAAALLASPDPAAALRAYESAHAPATAAALASGERPKPLAGKSLHPLAPIPPALATQLEANAKLMSSLGLQATPGLVWRDAKGAIQKRAGAPDASLADIFGSR
ncbi:MAG: thiol:disulfide interchange protein DsbG [Roseateles sp.]|uniref:thiol:disulfide interchange protein DsbG n=1 Tax=Roseateles sp. TaxID=1971397 RepID=UPI0040350BFC